MENKKFKVGDIITGTEKSDGEYVFTDSNALMKVIGISGKKTTVKIVKHPYAEHTVGHTFEVDPKFFKVCTEEEFDKTHSSKYNVSEKGLLDGLISALKQLVETPVELMKEEIKKSNKRDKVTITFDKFTELCPKIMEELDEEGFEKDKIYAVAQAFSHMKDKLFVDEWED